MIYDQGPVQQEGLKPPNQQTGGPAVHLLRHEFSLRSQNVPLFFTEHTVNCIIFPFKNADSKRSEEQHILHKAAEKNI